jgi:hypothetical protein
MKQTFVQELMISCAWLRLELELLHQENAGRVDLSCLGDKNPEDADDGNAS